MITNEQKNRHFQLTYNWKFTNVFNFTLEMLFKMKEILYY